MKQINLRNTAVMILSILLVTALIYGCGNKKSEESLGDTKEKTTAETKTGKNSQDMNKSRSIEHANVKLSSMQCGMCKKTIESALKNTDGIESVNVDKDEKVAHINYDKTKTDITIIEGTITAAGYDANGKKADLKAYEKLDDCCKLPEDQINKN